MFVRFIRRISFSFFLSTLFLFTSTASANTIRVPQDHTTIQAGIDAAVDGDTVLVDTGRYVENINFNGKNIVVGSLYVVMQDTSYITRTIIDGDSSGSVVTFESGEDSTAVLAGFTLTNGLALWGGGIYCNASSRPHLVGLKISGNRASGGGGIYCYESDPVLDDVTITGNAADGIGGGMACTNSHPVLRNVRLSRNVGHHGGALFCEMSNPFLRNVVIARNTGATGGAIHCLTSSPRLANVTITLNVAGTGSGLWCWQGSRPRLVNTILWNESPEEIYFVSSGDSNSATIAYSDVYGGVSGIVTNDNGAVNWLEGNMDADPLFVDPENGDFHLEQGSPAIDAGTPFFVWEGDTLVILPDTAYEGNAPDMGAYESPFSVGIAQEEAIPIQFALYENYPNPFNPATTLRYDLPERSQVTLTIYDILGRRVRTLVQEVQDPGYNTVMWDGTNDLGEQVSAGVYLYRIQAGGFVQTRKMVLLR